MLEEIVLVLSVLEHVIVLHSFQHISTVQSCSRACVRSLFSKQHPFIHNRNPLTLFKEHDSHHANKKIFTEHSSTQHSCALSVLSFHSLNTCGHTPNNLSTTSSRLDIKSCVIH